MKILYSFLKVLSLPVLARPYTAFTYQHQNYQSDEDLIYEVDLDDDCQIIESDKSLTQYWPKGGVKEAMKPMSKKYFGIRSLAIITPTQLKFRFPAISGIEMVNPQKKYLLITA